MSYTDFIVDSSGSHGPVASGTVDGSNVITLTLTSDVDEAAWLMLQVAGTFTATTTPFGPNMSLDAGSVSDSKGHTWNEGSSGDPLIIGEGQGESPGDVQPRTVGWAASAASTTEANGLVTGDTVTADVSAWYGFTGPGDATLNAQVHLVAMLFAFKGLTGDTPIIQHPYSPDDPSIETYYVATRYPDQGGSSTSLLYADDPDFTFMPHPMEAGIGLTMASSTPANGTYTPANADEQQIGSVASSSVKLVSGIYLPPVPASMPDSQIELGGSWSGAGATVLTAAAGFFLIAAAGLNARESF